MSDFGFYDSERCHFPLSAQTADSSNSGEFRSVSTSSPIRVLLVEDSPTDARLMQEVFKECGLSVQLTHVNDGEKAISFLTKEGEFNGAHTPDLVLLDLNLPKKRGLEVLRFIKSNRVLKLVPVIVLTTSEAERDIEEVYRESANCYLNKPIDYDKFVSLIKLVDEFWMKAAKLPGRIR